MDGTILIADDDRTIRTVLTQAFTRAGCRVRSTSSASTLWRWIEAGEGDVAITDVMMPDGDGLELVPAIRRKRPDLPVVVISARNTVLTAVRAADAGAYEYLPKPFDLKELMVKVSRALSPVPKQGISDSDGRQMLPLVGSSPAMQAVYRVLARVLNTDLNVMISGECGTGKDLVARTLHGLGHRSASPFVRIDAASVTSERLEFVMRSPGDYHGSSPAGFDTVTDSDAFSSRSDGGTGAPRADERATGGPGVSHADQDRSVTGSNPAQPSESVAGTNFSGTGFSATIYLDDVGEMPLDVQQQLLARLRAPNHANQGIRLISSSRLPVSELLKQGLFREDLFYRLNVITINLPPLRERLQDLPELATCFLQASGPAEGGYKTISGKGLQLMQEANWPGNVHELKNFIQRLVLLCPEKEIGSDFIAEMLRQISSERVEAVPVEDGNLSVAVEAHIRRYFDYFGDGLPPAGLYSRVIRQVELPLLALTLAATRGNQIRAAALLGINRNTLRKKIRDLSIEVTRTRKLM